MTDNDAPPAEPIDAEEDRADRLLKAIGAVIAATDAHHGEIMDALAAAAGIEIGLASQDCAEARRAARRWRAAVFATAADVITDQAATEAEPEPSGTAQLSDERAPDKYSIN